MNCHTCSKQRIPVPQYKDALTIFLERTGRNIKQVTVIREIVEVEEPWEEQFIRELGMELRYG